MSLPKALIIKQHFSFSSAAVFGGLPDRQMNILEALPSWTEFRLWSRSAPRPVSHWSQEHTSPRKCTRILLSLCANKQKERRNHTAAVFRQVRFNGLVRCPSSIRRRMSTLCKTLKNIYVYGMHQPTYSNGSTPTPFPNISPSARLN